MTQRSIEKHKMFDLDKRVLVAVSGGKDSLALWDVLLRLGYDAQGLYIGLGIDEEIGYSEKSLDMCTRFVAEHQPGSILHVVDLGREFGQTLPELARTSQRGRDKPCSVCGVATGHNLDDEAAVLMQNTLHWQTGYLSRQAPVLPQRDGLARKAKPFFRLYERESAAYALVQGIDYIYDECPFAKGATTNLYKELLNQLERNSPGVKQQFYLQFLQARNQGKVTFEEAKEITLHPCAHCGQPTTAGEHCAFCRLWE